MLAPDFLRFVETRIDEGQRDLATVTRKLLYRAAPNLFELVDFYDDATFLEPLLFAYFNAAEQGMTLEQILFGYIHASLRPEAVTVFADEDGIVDLPNVGYLVTRLASTYMQLHWRDVRDAPRLFSGNRIIPCQFESRRWLGDSSIEICSHLPTLLRPYFVDPDGNAVDVDITSAVRKHRESLIRAASIIDTYHHDYFANLNKVTRRLIIYEGAHPYSFATIRAHGVAFLNATQAVDEVFFVEDLIHQCGHIMFSAITSERTEYFRVDPDAPLSDFVSADDHHNSVYGAFHGLFTQANINHCLYACYLNNVFCGRQQHELLGRFSDDMKRFASALELLGRKELYTERGWWLYGSFKQIFVELYRSGHAIINRFDTSNQPYIFSYERFREANPS